jgi:nitronate monooxygenase
LTIDGAAARFCERFEVDLPIVNAPMAFVAGGRLAAAVAGAGGLGVIGGGYGDIAWIDEQRALAGQTGVGVGVITWTLADQPRLLDHLVDRGVRTVMLSFGDPTTHVAHLRRAGLRVLCQVQTVDDAARAADAGADAIVAQGSESGGHGSGTTTLGLLLPGVVAAAGSLPVLAAGGISGADDVRRVRALGAAGVVVGTRLYATAESLDTDAAKQRLVDCDQTVRTSVFDVIRGPAWPAGFDGRALVNDLTRRWGADEMEIRCNIDAHRADYARAVRAGDLQERVVWAGTGVSGVRSIDAAATVMSDLAAGLLAPQ